MNISQKKCLNIRIMARQEFATKVGVVAATVGSAVGLGNIWRFPFEAGMNGGFAFIMVYLICVFAVGVPIMIAEFIIGRSSHTNAHLAIKNLLPNSVLRFFPFLGMLASVLILSFYSVIAGWIMEYLYQSLWGVFLGKTSEEISAFFVNFSSDTERPVIWSVLFLIINYVILCRGVQKGIERISNILMPCLFIMLVAFCVNSLMMPGAKDALNFLFYPNFTKLTPTVVLSAIGQAFFSLSLGLTCLMTYASYFPDKTKLVKSAGIIASLDSLVAILAGIMIFPAVFSFGFQPEAGPKLVFEVLPNIFGQMPGGYIWSIMFFTLLFFASITSTISMSEISISYFVEEHKMNRNKAVRLNTIICMFLGFFCVLSFGVLSDFKIFGKTVFELFDFLSSNVILPLGGIIIAIIVGWLMDKKIVKNQLTNNGTYNNFFEKPVIFCLRYVSPVIVAIIFLYVLGVFDKIIL